MTKVTGKLQAGNSKNAEFPAPNTAVIPVEIDNSLEQAEAEQRWQIPNRYIYSVHGVHFIAPKGIYCEILKRPKIYSLPNTPKQLCGLTNVRGNLVPVYQLAFEDIFKTVALDFVLMMGDSPNSAALVVDTKATPIKENLLKINDSAIDNIPEQYKDFTTNTYNCGDTRYFEIEFSAMFNKLSSTANKHISYI